MPPIDAVPETRPVGPLNPQQLVEQENARLLAALIRALPSASSLRPETIHQLLSDPVKLSLLVRHAGLQGEIDKDQYQPGMGLQTALAKVAPQHLDRLLATLDRNGQPAINMDETYGEPAGLQTFTAIPTTSPQGDLALRQAAGRATILDVTPSDSTLSEAAEQPPFVGVFPIPPASPETTWRFAFPWPLSVLALVVAIAAMFFLASL